MIGDNHIVFKQIGDSYRIVELKFTSIQDLSKIWTRELSDDYLMRSPDGNKLIRVFGIKEFMELSLANEDGTAAQSLGKYIMETVQKDTFRFIEQTSKVLGF